jgi:hypothetical protein
LEFELPGVGPASVDPDLPHTRARWWAFAIGVASRKLEIGFGVRFSGIGRSTYTRSHRFRPRALLAYEHMFSSTRTSTLAQRALGALRLTRSFLLLEDDQAVDWEVDRDEHFRVAHPHRAPLRGRSSQLRRPGQPLAPSHACLCPVRRVPVAPVTGSRRSRQDTQADQTRAM